MSPSLYRISPDGSGRLSTKASTSGVGRDACPGGASAGRGPGVGGPAPQLAPDGEICGAKRDAETRVYALLRATVIARLRESNPRVIEEGLS